MLHECIRFILISERLIFPIAIIWNTCRILENSVNLYFASMACIRAYICKYNNFCICKSRHSILDAFANMFTGGPHEIMPQVVRIHDGGMNRAGVLHVEVSPWLCFPLVRTTSQLPQLQGSCNKNYQHIYVICKIRFLTKTDQSKSNRNQNKYHSWALRPMERPHCIVICESLCIFTCSLECSWLFLRDPAEAS